jgi:6-phosphofructokinase 1
MNLQSVKTKIRTLGKPTITSPLLLHGKSSHDFISEDERVLLEVSLKNIEKMISEGRTPASFEKAGPRKKIYFDTSKIKCGIVICGGLCPGLNDVIRSVVHELYFRYNVENVFGIKYGLQGFIPEFGHDYLRLTPERVENILEIGGSILCSSRGEQDIGEVVDSLERMNINVLFMIGGDGTLKAGVAISDEITRRNLKIGVIGIPKTIDNDISLVERSFGFDTAVDIASNAIKSTHNEAKDYPNCVGIIKLMGRQSGFIAATAALAQQEANFVLVPEVDFKFEGKNGLLAKLEKRLEERKHAVIVVAEGAGQYFFNDIDEKRDISGNIIFNDIGVYLKETINNHFEKLNKKISIKYIDPSYMIRSVRAIGNDRVFCSILGRDAVHAGIAGKTKMLISYWNNNFVHVPMEASKGIRKHINPNGKLWQTVMDATGQGDFY